MASAIRTGGGALTLYSAAITTAGTATGGTVTGLAGADYAALQFNFTYGSSGGTVLAYVQGSLDGGTTWTDLAALQFTNSSARKIVTVGPLVAAGTAIITATTGSLTANTQVPGLLGDQLRVQVVSTGTYAGNTTLAINAVVKA